MIPEQARELSAQIAALLGDDLVGVYLHGSFALDCGNPSRSDLDILVVTRRAGSATPSSRFRAEATSSRAGRARSSCPS